MTLKKKFVLEFDEVPALIFVSKGVRDDEIYINGEKVKFWTALELRSNMEEFTNFTIDYIARKDEKGGK